MVFGRRFFCFEIFSHDYIFRHLIPKRGICNYCRMCDATKFPYVLRKVYRLIISMFWAVVKISILSILNSSATKKREEKVSFETNISMTWALVSFFSVKTI